VSLDAGRTDYFVLQLPVLIASGVVGHHFESTRGPKIPNFN
jgi:hypothetical protein